MATKNDPKSPISICYECSAIFPRKPRQFHSKRCPTCFAAAEAKMRIGINERRKLKLAMLKEKQ